tara:strand:- start:1345 stop:1551 length:207 start_codon:yes stop_codon:yes gene_type:complete
LLGKITELDEEPSLLLENCYYVDPEGALDKYPLHTDQRDVFLTSDQVLTILDPSAVIAEKYGEAVGNE